MRKLFSLLLFSLMLLLSSCSDREVIPYAGDEFIGFKFFLFAEIDGEKFQGNGDAALIPGTVFKFRVYDNLLQKHIFTFESEAEGMNRAYMLLDETLYQQFDETLSKVLTEYLYFVFEPDGVELSELGDAVTVNEEGKIESLEFDYYGDTISLNIMKWFDDGDPRRIQIISGDNYMIFDITEFQNYDFPGIEDQITLVMTLSDESFFEWLGEAYGR